MKIIKGNIWDYHYPDEDQPPICVTTNQMITKSGRLVMGAGVAKQCRDRCRGQGRRDIDETLGRKVSWYGNKPHYVREWNIVSLPTKYDWRDLSDLKLICESAQIIKEMKEWYRWGEIYSPWPGCANGGLKKEDVKVVLEVYWNTDDFVIVEQ